MNWALDFDAGAWDPLVRTVPFVIGLALLLIAGMSIVRTMVIPRMTISWLFAVIIRGTDVTFAGIARRLRTYPARDRLLAWAGPLGILVALVVWLFCFLAAYALMIFGVTDVSLNQALLQAGSGLFTLGLIGTPGESVTILDFFAAMTGPAVIALLIGFLPTLYQAYLTRETRVLFDTAASGAPAWGPELLVRTHMLHGDDKFPSYIQAWIPWVAQVRLTQTLYPSLNRFRSAVGTRNWLISLMAALDATALRSSVRKETPDADSVTFLQQGTQAILSIDAAELGLDAAVRLRPWEQRIKTTLSVFGVTASQQVPSGSPNAAEAFLPPQMEAVSEAVTLDSLSGHIARTRDELLTYDTRDSTLTREEFDQALDYLAAAGVRIERGRDEAFEIFRRLRGRYESAAYHLAERFTFPPAPWSGPRRPLTAVIWPALAAKLQDP